jgi:hypothetical protein
VPHYGIVPGQGCERSKGRFFAGKRLTSNATFGIIGCDIDVHDTHTYLQAAPVHSSYLACPNQANPAGQVEWVTHGVVVFQTHALLNVSISSQAPPRDFDQLVDGHWLFSMGCSNRPILMGCSEVFRYYRSKHPLVLGQDFDQPVEDPFKISEKWGLRSQNFDPSMSLR